jgi:hypothetical protein
MVSSSGCWATSKESVTTINLTATPATRPRQLHQHHNMGCHRSSTPLQRRKTIPWPPSLVLDWCSPPIITFYLKKRFPNNTFLNAIHWPLFFAGTENLPPAVSIPHPSSFLQYRQADNKTADWYQLHQRICSESDLQQDYQVALQVLV